MIIQYQDPLSVSIQEGDILYKVLRGVPIYVEKVDTKDGLVQIIGRDNIFIDVYDTRLKGSILIRKVDIDI